METEDSSKRNSHAFVAPGEWCVLTAYKHNGNISLLFDMFNS